MIHFDRTRSSVLAWCDCGWREICVTPDGAHRVAGEHERNVHPKEMRARNTMYHARIRDGENEADER